MHDELGMADASVVARVAHGLLGTKGRGMPLGRGGPVSHGDVRGDQLTGGGVHGDLRSVGKGDGGRERSLDPTAEPLGEAGGRVERHLVEA